MSASGTDVSRQFVAMSTEEAEYVAVAAAIQTETTLYRMRRQAVIWMPGPTMIKTDKMATVEMILKPHGTKRQNNFYFRHHFIRQQLDMNLPTVMHFPAAQKKAELRTKQIKRAKFLRKYKIAHVGGHQQSESTI